MTADFFLLRRLKVRERELGLAIRKHLERNERPPATLKNEYDAVAAQLREARTIGEGPSNG